MNQTLRRRRRREIRRELNKIKLIALLIAVAIFLTFLFNIVLANSSVQGEMAVEGKGYITITVKARDTLWSIAEAHMNTDYYSYESFIREVTAMNRIESATIYAGEQLLIPVIKAKEPRETRINPLTP